MTLIVLLAAIAVHELGHLAAAGLAGVNTFSGGICASGLRLSFDFSHVGYAAEALVHAGGSIAGVVTALTASLLPWRAALSYSGISLTLAALNLLPLSSFDGGALLSSVLSQFLMPDTAWRVCRVISALTLAVLWIAALWVELRIGANMVLLGFVCVLLVEGMH